MRTDPHAGHRLRSSEGAERRDGEEVVQRCVRPLAEVLNRVRSQLAANHHTDSEHRDEVAPHLAGIGM